MVLFEPVSSINTSSLLLIFNGITIKLLINIKSILTLVLVLFKKRKPFCASKFKGKMRKKIKRIVILIFKKRVLNINSENTHKEFGKLFFCK